MALSPPREYGCRNSPRATFAAIALREYEILSRTCGNRSNFVGFNFQLLSPDRGVSCVSFISFSTSLLPISHDGRKSVTYAAIFFWRLRFIRLDRGHLVSIRYSLPEALHLALERVGCYVHGRRYLFQISSAQNPPATWEINASSSMLAVDTRDFLTQSSSTSTR